MNMIDRETIKGEPYIHLNWRESIIKNVTHTDAEVKGLYRGYAQKKKIALEHALGMDVEKAGAIVAQITGLYETIEERGDELTKAFLKTGLKAANLVRETNPGYLKSMSEKIVNDKSELDRVLKGFQNILDQSSVFNKDLIDFFVSKSISPTSLAARGMQLQNLKIMDLEKKTGTSLRRLEYSLKAIESSTKAFQLPIEPQFINDIDKIIQSKGEYKGVASIIRGGAQRVINAQGFFLEGVMWGLMEGALQDGLIKGLDGVTVDLVGGEGDKTDLALKKLAKDGTVSNIGLSMKATEKGVVKTGYYGTHPLYRFFEMSKILNTKEEYVFDNILAHNKTTLKKAILMNRFIAARAAWEAVTGAQGDEIYFFVYLNKIISAESMYESMANGAEPFRLVLEGVTKIKDLNVRSPIDQYDRSHRVLEDIREFKKVQIITKTN